MASLHDGGKHDERWHTPLPKMLDMLYISHEMDEIYEDAYGKA